MTGRREVVTDPYAGVDWSGDGRFRAAMHLHTRQSDGHHHVAEVVRRYRELGFRIISITDHDWNRPDQPPEKYSPWPRPPRPHNYPANPTWPWTDYGCDGPGSLGLVGIEGNELTYRHHINSYFCDYGVWYEKTGAEAPYGGIVDGAGREVREDDQLSAIAAAGGLAILNHPGTPDSTAWWVRRPLEWYLERFRKHPAACLAGLEVTNEPPETAGYTEALWDQLLARLMPRRPAWGFAGSDMHRMDSVRLTHGVFLLGEASAESVRRAMLAGRFYSVAANVKTSQLEPAPGPDPFPGIRAVTIDRGAGTITIRASGCDEIRWISAPRSLEPVADYRVSNRPWPPGEVVGRGETLDYRAAPGVKRYFRAELRRSEGTVVYRLLTNPWGVTGRR